MRLLAVSLLLVFGWSDSFAQRDDKISLWADDEMTYCALNATPAIQSVHMFHTGSQPATASRFSAPKPACWQNATWLADHITPSYLAFGNSQTDLSIAYMGPTTGCTSTPIYLGTIDYLVTGGTPSCCRYEASPATGAATIQVVDCYFVEFEALAGRGVTINPAPECPCSAAPPPPKDPEIAIYADAGMTTCSLVDDVAGIRSVYLFHTGGESATGSEFAVPLPSCWTGATFLSDHIEAPFLAIGSSQTDLSIAYTHCLESPVYLGRIDYYSTGVGQPCCEYPVVPAAGQPGIWVSDCDFEGHLVGPGPGVTVNPTADCPCSDEPTVSVERTTWGKIKAMYRR